MYREGTCRIDGGPVDPMISFPSIFGSDFVESPEDIQRGMPFQVKLGVGRQSGLLQMLGRENRSIHHQYWYRSGVNSRMVRDLRDVIDGTDRWADVRDHDTVLSIGCNDGTELQHWRNVAAEKGARGLHYIGVDPAQNLREAATKHGDIVTDYFSKEAYWRVARAPAKAITSIAMFYDLDDPVGFAKDVRSCLAADGIWCCQQSYTPLTIRQNAFDNFDSEHVAYYNVTTFLKVANRAGFKPIDVELNDVNCGSFRIYCTPWENPLHHIPEHLQMLGQHRLEALQQKERLEFDKVWWRKIYGDFQSRVEALGRDTKALLEELNRAGKKVYGYGASTKGNVLLQTYGLTPQHLRGIADANPAKHGRYCIGSGIRVCSEQEMREDRPDYLLVLPWTFARHFAIREAELLRQGCRMIIPLPNIQVLDGRQLNIIPINQTTP